MPKLIQDEFTSRPISRQRKYQMRKRKSGRCRICAKPGADETGLCPEHRAQSREYSRAGRTRTPTPQTSADLI